MTNIQYVIHKIKTLASNNFWDLGALIFTVAGIFFIPLSPKIVNMLFPLVAIMVLFSGNWKEKWFIIKNDKIILLGLILLLLFLLGMFYSEGSLRLTLRGFFKYTKILYLLFLIPLFSFYPNWKKTAENGLIAGVYINIIIDLLIIYCGYLPNKAAYHVGGYFIHPIYTSALLAFSNFILMHRIVNFTKKDVYFFLNIFLFLLGVYTLFFIYSERTGYILGIGLFFLFVLQVCGKRTIWIFILFIFMSVGFVYEFSHVFHVGVNDVFNSIIQYQKNKLLTSIGYRMAFAEYGFKIIQSHLFWGAGTGSFSEMYAAVGGPPLKLGQLLGHPHNEYIFITTQIGIVGLAVFLFWLVIQWLNIFKLSQTNKYLAQGVILAFILNGFTNATLSINSAGMIYIVFLSIYCSSKYAELTINKFQRK